MPKIAITAFQPFLNWPVNASQEILDHWSPDTPPGKPIELVREVLPVDYSLAEPRVRALASDGVDFSLHLGQSSQIRHFALEMVALNVKHDHQTPIAPLSKTGPTAFISGLPLEAWRADLESHQISAEVSFHAGTYLCNAVYYWATQAMLERGLTDRSLFVHVPVMPPDAEEADSLRRQGAELLSRLMQLISLHVSSHQLDTA